GDLGNGVRLVRRLERAGQKLFLRHRLGTIARIDTGTPQIQQFLRLVQMSGVYDSRVDQHVVVDEFRRPVGIREDAAHSSSNEINVVGTVRAEPVVDGGLVAEIQLCARGGQDVLDALRLQAAQNGRTDQPAVAGDENAGRHALSLALD